MIVHTTIGGSRVRVQISNAFGKKPLVIGAASFALRKSESEIDETTLRPLTFSGKSSVTVRPGALLLSDALIFDLKPLSDIAISLFVPKDSGAPTVHTLGLHTSYISKGDMTADVAMPTSTKTLAYLWLSSVDVVTSPKAFAIVALGDSITDGFKTTADANQAWPTLLASRFNANKSAVPVSVLNQGISGNEVLRDGAGVSALARFDRDVLSRSGVKWMILLEGINDINLHGQITGPTALSAEDLIFGYKQLIERAHSHGIKVMGATVMPEEGVWLATETGEATRREVNRWIRTSGEFDSVIDFDEVVRDPTHPSRLKPEFNPGDNIHPNDLGNKAMADAFVLTTFMK
jgi:lysophospholipase L1-like esterase